MACVILPRLIPAVGDTLRAMSGVAIYRWIRQIAWFIAGCLLSIGFVFLLLENKWVMDRMWSMLVFVLLWVLVVPAIFWWKQCRSLAAGLSTSGAALALLWWWFFTNFKIY